MNTNLHAVTDAEGRPIRFLVTAGQSQRLHGRGRPFEQPSFGGLAPGRPGFDADWFREALKNREIKPCIPCGKSRGKSR